MLGRDIGWVVSFWLRVRAFCLRLAGKKGPLETERPFAARATLRGRRGVCDPDRRSGGGGRAAGDRVRSRFGRRPKKNGAPGPRRKSYRLENWKRFRAPGCPYFLRSLLRGSRVRNPFRRREGRRSGSAVARARAIPILRAPA